MPISPFGPTLPDGNMPAPEDYKDKLGHLERLYRFDPRLHRGWDEAKRAEIEHETNAHGQPDARFKGVIPTLPRYLDFGKDHIRPDATMRHAADPPNTQVEGEKGHHTYRGNFLDFMSHFMRKLLPQGDK